MNFSRTAIGQHVKTDIFEITIYLVVLLYYKMLHTSFYKMLGGCIFFIFISPYVPRFSVKKSVNQ